MDRRAGAVPAFPLGNPGGGVFVDIFSAVGPLGLRPFSIGERALKSPVERSVQNCRRFRGTKAFLRASTRFRGSVKVNLSAVVEPRMDVKALSGRLVEASRR
jgi:hypothetical protein